MAHHLIIMHMLNVFCIGIFQQTEDFQGRFPSAGLSYIQVNMTNHSAELKSFSVLSLSHYILYSELLFH